VRALTAAELLAAVTAVAEGWPDAQVHLNEAGNLSVVAAGALVAYVDLRTGQLHLADALDAGKQSYLPAL
jgi:hypothetical protein